MERFLYSAVYRDGHTTKTYLFVLEMQPGDDAPDDDCYDVADMLGLAHFDHQVHDLIISRVENFDHSRLTEDVALFDQVPKLC
jgi:hypothetical protein